MTSSCKPRGVTGVDYESAPAMVRVVTRALAESHARWTAGNHADEELIAASVTPLRQYEAEYAVRAMEVRASTSGWISVAVEPVPLYTWVLTSEADGLYQCGRYSTELPVPQGVAYWSKVHAPSKDLD